MSKYFQKPTGKKHDKAFADKWFAFLYADSKAKEGVTYKNVFLDDFEKMKKKRKIKSKINRKGADITPVNLSTMGDDDAPDSSPNEIHVGGNHLYYEEGITFSDFQKKSNDVKNRRNSI